MSLKKNLNASSLVYLLSFPQSVGKVAKRVSGIIGCKDKNFSHGI